MNSSNICLISKEPIENNITLNLCNHSFDYYYLYQEIIQQKKRHPDYFRCPYCRMTYTGTIPYYEIDEVEKINNVNHNPKSLLPILKCELCDSSANHYKHGVFCHYHYQKTIRMKCSSICKNGNKCNHYAVLGDVCKKHSINK